MSYRKELRVRQKESRNREKNLTEALKNIFTTQFSFDLPIDYCFPSLIVLGNTIYYSST